MKKRTLVMSILPFHPFFHTHIFFSDTIDLPSTASPLSWHAVSERKDLVKNFLKEAAAKTCANCNATAMGYKKNRDSKIFQRVPLGRKRKDTPIVESTEEGTMRYLSPLEVASYFQRLWETESEAVNLIWSGFKSKDESQKTDGYKIFFLSVLPVPPNKYRPVNKVNDMLMEHPQNVYYSKILDLCRQLIGSVDGKKGDADEEENGVGGKEGKETGKEIGRDVKDQAKGKKYEASKQTKKGKENAKDKPDVGENMEEKVFYLFLLQ
jgi:hypothetical protein